MPIPYISLDVTLKCITPAFLPLFKGSTLRGAFGHGLKKVSCTLRNQDCSNCLLRQSCAYSLIFATEKLENGRIAARPHPYILNLPTENKREYQQGDELRFNLILLNGATEFLPHIVYTLEEMSHSGLGKGSKSGAGKFLLSSIHSGDDTIYDVATKMLKRPSVIPDLSLSKETPAPCSQVALHMLTPLRIKQGGRFMRNVTFPAIIRAALRRISSLEKYYGGGEPPLDYRGLCQEAENVEIINTRARWQDYKRYSNRQENTMMFGGLLGKVEFAGNFQSFLPILSYGQKINLGKQTAFGLGRVALEIKA